MPTDPQLPFAEPATTIGLTAHWNASTGWRMTVWSLTGYETLAVPDDEREMPGELYEQLTLSELLDVVDAEVRARRRF